MTFETLEHRLSAVEAELAQLKQRLEKEKVPAANSWLDQVFGVFKDCPEFEEAVRLGREWRESQRMEYDDAMLRQNVEHG